MNAPQQAFAALKAARPPATERGRERQAILVKEDRDTRHRYEWLGNYEWAKARVCSILRLVRYDQWNGYIPPQTQAPTVGGRANPNLSTERKLLVQLTHEVQHFERTGDLPAYATEAA